LPENLSSVFFVFFEEKSGYAGFLRLIAMLSLMAKATKV